MYKIGDYLTYSGYRSPPYFRVVSVNALGFEVVQVSEMRNIGRKFYKTPKVRYKHEYNTTELVPLTKEIVDKELIRICAPYEEFKELLP